MPNFLDVLIERLKQFDEVALCELLDISSEEIIERFRDVIISRQSYLFGEIEELTEEWMDNEDLSDDEYGDGFQMIEPEDQ